MKPTDVAAEQTAEPAEPQPWRTPEDAQGWRVVGVGKRHPRWLEFEIAAIAARHNPAGFHGPGGVVDEYRPVARLVAQRLRELDPAAATCEDVSRLAHDALAASYIGRPVEEE